MNIKSRSLRLLNMMKFIPNSLINRSLSQRGITYRPLEKYKRKSLYKGYQSAFCISIDFDYYNQSESRVRIFREATLSLLDLARHYDVPLTWAICGETAMKEESLFSKITASNCELAIHTYSHQDLRKCSQEQVELEIDKTLEIIGSRRVQTFVFPFNREAHYEVLRRKGFVCYRGKQRVIGYPLREHGMWNIAQTYYLRENSLSTHKIIIEAVKFSITKGCVFHLWFHPWNLSANGNVQGFISRVMVPLFSFLCARRESGDLWLCTVGELAEACQLLCSTHTIL